MKHIRLKHIIQIIISLFFSFSAYSQTIHVTGKVVGEKNEVLDRVYITLRYVTGGRIIAYSQTSVAGNFELRKDLNGIHQDSLELSFSHVAYAPHTLRIPSGNEPLLIEMKSKNYELREVSVSASKIRQSGDTVTYLVSSFSAIEDRTIGDVLKKMPGVEVLESGQIKYQGKPINKFYIEGSDMLEGRYGLATNNIAHTDVASVEVMENHQPIRALEDVVFSESPAMNIKLKEDAKSRWAGTVKGGGGVPGLWIAEAVAMRFKAKSQTLNTYKGNNTGNQMFELNLHFLPSDFASILSSSQLPTYIQVSPSSASDIGSSRSTFNQTNNLTSNNLLKIGKDFDLTTEFTGSLDRRESEYVSKTTYFLGDEQISIEDKTEDASSLKKSFTGKIRLKSNQPKYYLNNNLNFSYDRNDPCIDILGSYPNRQSAGIENIKIGNDFDILHRFGEKIFTIRSSNEYTSKPQSLEVSKNDLPPVRQNISLSSFHSNNSTEYSFMIGKLRVRSPIKLLYQYKQIENKRDDERNNLNTHKLRLDISPSVEFNVFKVRTSLSGRLYYQSLTLENKTHHLYGANPSLFLSWPVFSLFSMHASFSRSSNLPNENSFYYGNIMNSYRSLSSGYIDFSTGKTNSFSTSISYKDVLKALFSDLRIGLSKIHQTRVSGQDFIDDYILSYSYPGNLTAESFTVSGSLSKGIGWIYGSAAIYPSFVRSKSSLVRNGITIPYSSDIYMVRGSVNSKVSNNCNLTYDVTYGYNKNKMASSETYFSSTRLSESLKVTYAPLKRLQMSYKIDHYCNELTSDNFKHFFFSDVSVSYLRGNRWEFAMSIKNIFDEKNYSYFIESDLTSFYRSYKIRPRNIFASATYRF
jgi:hypothetical protein